MKSLSPYVHESGVVTIYEVSDYVNTYIPDGAAVTVTVPALAKFAVFTGTGNFWVDFSLGGTAVLPTVQVTDGTASVMNPSVRRLPPDQPTFSIIAQGTTVVQIAFYR
jgi:hypothetical protein